MKGASMQHHIRWLVAIILLTIFAVWVSLPTTEGVQWQWDADGDGTPDLVFAPSQRLGLDLVGGLRVLLQAELPPGSYTIDDLRQAANNVARRVNALGVTEPTVQVQGNSRILVELPGETDPNVAIDTIQQTALLEFVDFSGLGAQALQLEGRRILTTEQLLIEEQRRAAAAEAGIEVTEEPEEERLVNPLTGQPFRTVMTGAGLQAAAAQFYNNSWIISFELTPEGSQVFGPFTAASIGQPLAIVLDGVVLSAPTIQDALTTGGTITGNFTEEEAKTLALQLRSGALP